MILYINSAGFERLHFALIAEKIKQKKISIKHPELEKTAEYLEAFLKENKTKLTEIQKIVVVVGKGSFTGVRVGVALALAFAMALGIKAYAVEQTENPLDLKDLIKKKMVLIKAGYQPEYAAKPNITIKKQKAFTLIELLVVIAIIGLLASVLMVSIGNARLKSREVKRLADIRQIRSALEMYVNDNGNYPGAVTTYYWISDNNYPGSGTWPPCSSTTGGLKPYIANVCNTFDPSGYQYAYSIDSSGRYHLGARFETTANQGTQFYYNNGVTPVANYYEPKN